LCGQKFAAVVDIKYQTFASLKRDHNFFFPVAFTFAHLAFANADSLALAAALIFLRAFFTGLAALIAAHLAF
jgi:ABC-type uncharacterized transport system permease subunit